MQDRVTPHTPILTSLKQLQYPMCLLCSLQEDGTNVNLWHWNEKNLLPWSRQRISELVSGISADVDATLGSASITGVKELTGEVCAESLLHKWHRASQMAYVRQQGLP